MPARVRFARVLLSAALGGLCFLLLKSDAQITQARQAVQAYRQLLETLDQLSWINLELLRRSEPLAGEPAPA